MACFLWRVTHLPLMTDAFVGNEEVLITETFLVNTSSNKALPEYTFSLLSNPTVQAEKLDL